MDTDCNFTKEDEDEFDEEDVEDEEEVEMEDDYCRRDNKSIRSKDGDAISKKALKEVKFLYLTTR